MNFRTPAKENGTLCKNPNFVRTNEPVDSVRARKIIGMQMAVLSLSCYTQPLNNRIFIVHDFFFIIPLSDTPIRILPVNKTNFEMLNEFN